MLIEPIIIVVILTIIISTNSMSSVSKTKLTAVDQIAERKTNDFRFSGLNLTCFLTMVTRLLKDEGGIGGC